MSKEKENNKNGLQSRSGFWILLVAAVVLEATACIQYFYTRVAIRNEATAHARAELRAAELEINVATAELEAATKMLTNMAELSLDYPDGIKTCTSTLLETLDDVESAGVAFIPNYYPSKGKWYEICSSRVYEGDSMRIFTRQIGGEHHDYFQAEWFSNGLNIDGAWWSEPYLDDAGAKTMVVSCSHPVRDKSGQIVAVVCIDLSLDRLQKVSDYLQVYKDSYYSISSSTGVDIVARPDTTPGRRYMVFDEEIDVTGWKISIIIPEDILFADLNRTGWIVTILMLLGLALLIFILYRSGKNLQNLIDLNTKQQRIEGELEIAQTIQRAMLPKVFPPFLDRKDLNIYGMVEPAKEIGGDLYDFYIRHEKLFYCVGDVSGKGVPAALLMATTRSLFRSVTSHEERAAEIVSQMNDALNEQNEQNMFVTLFLGVLDLKSGEMEYCNAGHNAPILIESRNAISELSVLPNLPLGVEPGFAFQPQKTEIAHGNTLFLYTDGLTEAENKGHEQYGEERMLAELHRTLGKRPQEIVESMRSDVVAFVDGAQQSDDLTMLAIRFQVPAIVMRNDIQQIPTLADWVDGLGVPDELNMPINLALEEAVSNVMLYAYPDQTDGKVFVEYVRSQNDDGEEMVFTISDNGIAFDPTQRPEVDITLSAEDRAIGGLGIHLVRQLMDTIYYERKENKNILTLIKKL